MKYTVYYTVGPRCQCNTQRSPSKLKRTHINRPSGHYVNHALTWYGTSAGRARLELRNTMKVTR